MPGSRSALCVLVVIIAGAFADGCAGPADSPPPAADLERLMEAAVAEHDAPRVSGLLRLNRPGVPVRLARLAIEGGDLSLVRMLHESGFDVNAGVGGNGESLLGSAARVGSAPVVRFLLDRGADPNGRFGPGASYLPLYEAIRWGHVSAAAALLEGGADPNARILMDLDGNRQVASTGPTLLMVAAAVGTPDIVELLVAWGANPRLEDWRRRTAIDWLARRDDPVRRIRAAITAARRGDARVPATR